MALRTARRVEGKRLVYYRERADQAFWDRHWAELIRLEAYEAARRGQLSWFSKMFPRHLPREGRILEAGCGVGQIVVALRARGYDCSGVEWGQETVDRVRALLPEMPIEQGDVTALRVPDGHYQAYISLGVIEHRREGPEPFLKEAHRVLADDGVMLVSVPHFNLQRRLRAKLGAYRGDITGLEFYQFAFRAKEMKALLRGCGFRVTHIVGYDSLKGLRDEFLTLRRVLDWLLRIPKVGGVIHRLFRWCGPMNRHLGHMVLFVCRKET